MRSPRRKSSRSEATLTAQRGLGLGGRRPGGGEIGPACTYLKALVGSSMIVSSCCQYYFKNSIALGRPIPGIRGPADIHVRGMRTGRVLAKIRVAAAATGEVPARA